MKFRITVPATSANIGPGFDAMGLALSLYNRFEINQADRTKVLGCEEQFAGPDNLFLQAFRHAAGLLGIGVPEIELTVDAEIPLARGLGSSAAMIVGGVAAAFVAAGMGGEGFDEDEKRRIFEIAAALEGHPDNAAPAVFGGFCSSILKNEDSPRAFYARCSVDPPSSCRREKPGPPCPIPSPAATPSSTSAGRPSWPWPFKQGASTWLPPPARTKSTSPTGRP